MGVQSRSGWQAAIGSVSDTFASIRQLPQTYFALFVLGAVPTFASLGRDRTSEIFDPAFTQAEIWDIGIGVATLILMIPLGFGLLRYFAGAFPIYPSGLLGLILRFIGWTILLSLLFLLVWLVVVVLATFASFLDGEGDQTIAIFGLIFAAAGFVVMTWLALRFVTFWPVLAIGQPSPIKNAFRETRGWTWYVFRAAFFVFVIWVVLAIVALAVQFLLLGVPLMDFGALVLASAEKQGLGARLAFAVMAGVSMALYVGFQAAFYGRIFRNIRGIGQEY